MNVKRIETEHTVWEFDFDTMRYYRHPKNESPEHPVRGAKPFEHAWVEFHRLEAFEKRRDEFTRFCVWNTGIEWGKGALTESFAVPSEDLSWVAELEFEDA